MLLRGVPYHLMQYAIEGLLLVEKGCVHWSLFLAPLLRMKQAEYTYSINRLITSYEAAAVVGELNDFTTRL